MAAALEATGAYRILRKLSPRSVIHPAPEGAQLRTALFVDVETTGLDAARHEIIELAMVPFTYGRDGTIHTVGEPFQGMREPAGEISAEITALTGITADMVAGKSIDVDAVCAVVDRADLVVAHNAGFDRQFLERFCPAFEHKPWGCTNVQIDWKAEGFEGTRLGYLVAGAGFFYDRHRALNDCHAAIELLARPLPRSGRSAFGCLLEKARTPSWRIFASYAPFDLKDVLRERGYRWNGEGQGLLRAWFIDVEDDRRDAELAFLETEIYRGEADVPVRRIDAYNRFSSRI
jgi:DNA polymerase-3 subunit epsilon